jgi:ATP-dependent Lhr-like helicase
VATERFDELLAVHPAAAASTLPDRPSAGPTRYEAVRELFRGRLEILGPTTSLGLADSLGVSLSDADIALAALEREGVVLRGRFTPGITGLEWCDRRLLARIHRYTLDRLRAEIEPVSAADFMRFLFRWQRVESEERVAGLEGLASVLEQLDGYEVPAGAWEPDVLASRCQEYDPTLLDMLCLTGRVAWARLSATPATLGRPGARPIRTTPMALVLREHLDDWLALAGPKERPVPLSSGAEDLLGLLNRRGALFFAELVSGTGLLRTQAEQGLAELASAGLVTSDSFTGLRALLTKSDRRKPTLATAPRRYRSVPFSIDGAGRWARLERGPAEPDAEPARPIEFLARTLLRRYGVVFRRVLSRESLPVSWGELLRVYRRLEARGEIRGGRFVAGASGEQFALPDAIPRLRAVRRAAKEQDDRLVVVSGADPLNLTGFITPGDRVPALATNRIAWRHGVPIAAMESGSVRWFHPESDPTARLEVERALARKRISPTLRAYLGMTG